MAPRLIDPNGQPIGGNPVVAHLLTLPPGLPPDAVATILRQWQDLFGVPTVALMPGMQLLGAVLADGQVQHLPLDPELTAKVQVLLAEQAPTPPPGDPRAN